MKANQLAVCLSLTALAIGVAAKADPAYFASANTAQAACGSEPVVWIDLDHGKYYKIGQGEYGKMANGVYACERAAHAKYREGKSDPTAVAAK